MQLFRNTPSNLWDGAIDVVSSAKAANECTRISGQELPLEEESVYEKDALAAKARELDAQTQFKVDSHMDAGKCNKKAVGTRWALTWKMVEGVKTVKARTAAKGYRDPDLKDGLVGTSGCVSLRSPHLQVTPLAARRKERVSASRWIWTRCVYPIPAWMASGVFSPCLEIEYSGLWLDRRPCGLP